MAIEYRVPRADEWRELSDVVRVALLAEPSSDETWERSVPTWEDCDNESAWEVDRCVGTAGAFRFEMVVPGGARLPTAGITRVGVLPTHRRRGIASELMRRMVVGAAERGKALAALRASEATIYRRFGFGVATETECIRVDPRDAVPIAGDETGSMRLLARDEMTDVVGRLYPQVALRRPGTLTRPGWMTDRYLRETIAGSKPQHVAVHSDADGVDDGYVHYRVRWNESDAMMAEQALGTVLELWGASPHVERELWRYLCSIDLIERWTADDRPLDDVSRSVAADRRAVATQFRADEHWLRLIDADAALTARTYAAIDEPLAIGIIDPLLPDNTGTWVIAKGEAVRDDTATPALRVDVADIGAVYLGGTSWADLDAAFRVTDAAGASPSSEVLARADSLFAVRPLPYGGTDF